MRLYSAVVLVLLAVLACPAIAQQPPAPAPGPAPAAPPGPRGGMRMGAPDIDGMVDMLATRLNLTGAEKAATKKAVHAKMDAAAALRQQLQALGEAARNEKATDKELTAALGKFDAALASYRQKVKAIDADLVKSLSVRARAALTAIGVVDNGMGNRFGGMMGRGPDGQGRQRMRAPGGFGAPAPGAQRAPQAR